MKQLYTTLQGFLAAVLMLLLFNTSLKANNIQVTNVKLTGQNTGDDFTLVQFDLSWENSWRTSSAPFNWDAAWVFVKYRVGSGEWQHALLNDAGHSAGTGTGATIDPGLLTPDATFHATTNPALGAFIYRPASGTGNFGITGAKLRWNYGANGVADDANLEVKVMAIEMVYVPQGAFLVGSGGTESGSFTNGSWTSGATIPLSISSENALTIGQSAGNLWGTSSSGNNTIGGAGTLNADFPKGLSAFYSMKYEISQQQYVDFLNTLTTTKAANRYSASNTGERYGITVSSGVYSTTNPFVACGFLSWMDGAAYSDWAGLRPMTELEFEKACRGTATPVTNEYAWGNATATAANNITNPGVSSETTNTSGANAVFGSQANVQGPMRVGLFAKSGTTRAQSGASYWGIMELSGNLWERTVTVGNTNGRSFTGIHGNGTLSANGHANEAAWPGLTSGEVTAADGSGYRGGSYAYLSNGMQVSGRHSATNTYAGRFKDDGFRGVRSIPFLCGTGDLVVNHRAGAVSPVDKITSYSTVTNIPGETSKCWITKNLGATQQATAVNDATEPSSGWYWQFNRKQGYKHDGTTLTPAWTITFINENSEWQTTNDPCALELGSSWRLPTSTEWTNVDGSSGGNWTNWNGPWNSGLKMHAAGYLNFSNGLLSQRGSSGYYWSSAQSSLTIGWYLIFGSGLSYIYNGGTKAFGLSARCLRTLQPEVTTTAASAINFNSAVSGGTIVSDESLNVTARGVCWSASTGPTIALSTKTNDGSGFGTFTSNLTGLASNTRYYVRAYATTSAGTVYGNEVTFTTVFLCGTDILTVNHTTAGGVAPVNKSTTYGTVTNIPGETSKCWITKNLGATQQATSVNDATEASAGWYWQFNRKQGYQHDGTTLTPAWTITIINENTDWQTIINDPCALELGSSWRLPTSTEWTNVDGSSGGNWTNWNGPWNSGLKMHAAGYLFYSNGSLSYRSLGGYYWSSTQGDSFNGWGLSFGSGHSVMGNNTKVNGFNVRCLRSMQPEVTTTAASSINSSSAVSGGTIVSDGSLNVTARGVCWSASTGPTIALSTKTTDGSDFGTFTSNLTGLASDKLYYVRAYATTSAGTVYGNEVTFTTAFLCGTDILTVNHTTAGGIAPVDKSTTYGTVTNIPGYTSKCWITKNLGATQQATAVSDTTEASAGWYWQFNRKKGYKHDGSTLTPAWTITYINENSDWQTANDPCALELGSSWRLPTSTEWILVDGGGNWTNWNGPWNSGLKMHAAGYLGNSDGSLNLRGSYGYYWSSVQYITNNSGWGMNFYSSLSNIYNGIGKADGVSVRCLRDN